MPLLVSLNDHLPQKQGLRLEVGIVGDYSGLRQAQWPSSTKTRIKTITFYHRTRILPKLNDHLPQKQGLRPTYTNPRKFGNRAQWPSSTKTRIKTVPNGTHGDTHPQLNDHLPQKQGLRLHPFLLFHNVLVGLNDHLPQKQGLRPVRV